jgi:hypothetical protein
MNLSTSYLFQYFQSLSTTGKVSLIAGYILMALLIILWEKSKARRRAATRLPTLAPNSTIEETEKLIHAITTPPSKDNQYDARNRVRHLLETFRSNLSKCIVYCKSHNDGEKHPNCHQDYIPKHIRSIVDCLRRRVNQSGKEPY